MSSETANPWVAGTDQSVASQSARGATEAGGRSHLSWRHPAGMWGLSVVNFVLRIITLGIYDFWGRTEVRQRLWSSIRFMQEPLVYTGTGKELFLGFLIIFGIILIPILLISAGVFFVFGPNSPVSAAYQLMLYLGIFLLVGMAIYRAQRYRLSRTTWRGIRGSLTGNSMSYAWTHFWTLLLIGPTLGWIVPWRSTKLQGLITSHTHFGDRAFQFNATAGPLYKSFAVLWFGVVAIFVVGSTVIGGAVATATAEFGGLDVKTPEAELGKQFVGMTMLVVLIVGYLLYLVMSAWYRSRMINHFAQATTFEGARFKGHVRGLGLLWIDFTNLLILAIGPLLFLGAVFGLIAGVGFLGPGVPTSLPVATGSDALTQGQIFGAIFAPLLLIVAFLTFTLFLPVTQARSMRYLIERLSLDGHIPVGDILQSTAEQTKTGEGLAQAFDVDGF
ncbi:MAG: DUF898 family protein [Pseudomonadota bacterium]